MTPRRKYSFWIDDEQTEGLKTIKERDGVLESKQIRRAINDWLQKRRDERGTQAVSHPQTLINRYCRSLGREPRGFFATATCSSLSSSVTCPR
jgi:hypothetical protein